MTKDIDQATEAVNPVRRDKLTRLGDRLDAAERRGPDEWVTLYFEYEPLAIKLALATKPPKITIKSTAELWQADAMGTALFLRMKAIEADIENNSGGTRTMRTAADLKASLAVTTRDFRIVAAAIRKYQADKRAKKQAAITVAKHRRERVRGIANAIHSAIGRAAS
jgi:hypothetical protein